MTVTAVNDAPGRDGGRDGRASPSGGTAVVLDAGLTLSDADSSDAGRRHGVDRAGFVSRRYAELHQPERHHRQLRQRHRRADADRQRRRWRNYQTALELDHLHFDPATIRPTSAATPSRTITWQANDGALSSTAATSTVTVTAVDDAPVVTAGATVELHRAGLGRRARSGPDAERCRQYDTGKRHGVDRELRRRRYAELHQPERHHRQLRQRHRRADADWQRLGGRLPDGAALDHLLLSQRQSDQLRQPTPAARSPGQANDGALEQRRPPPARSTSRRSTTPRFCWPERRWAIPSRARRRCSIRA